MSGTAPFNDRERERLFPGDSEMAGRMRAFDWSRTDLGPPEGWPQSLRTAVSICLESRYPIVIWWGNPGFTTFYNDAYISFLGATKHPGWLGRSGRGCWSEIWPTIGPMLEGVFASGEATWSEDLLLVLNRNIPQEEGYFTFSYSPVRDDTGRVGGVFCACYETTSRVIGERRLKTLRELAARTTEEARTAEGACRTAARILAGNLLDLPFAVIYLADPDARAVRLAGVTGLPEGSPACPGVIDLSVSDEDGWPLHAALESGHPVVVRGLGERFGPQPWGGWPDPAHTAVVVPVPQPGQSRLAGFLVAGVSPRRPIDDAYRGFFDLLGGHIATAIADARAYEAERQRAEALAEIDRAKTAFFSNVSHEFRTPLTLMLGPVEDALADPAEPLSAGQRERLETVHRSSLRLLKLVNALLDFSRIEAGRVQAAYEPTDLAALTSDLASNFRSACERAGLRLVVDCPPLPEPVYVDRDMWEKVVLNLLSNALKHTFAGEIGVRLRDSGDAAELTIQDTGTGIPAEELPRIFERFHRVEGARGRTYEGTGIGLALVQELVKLHGGSARAESTYGQGSAFVVSVPRGKDHLPAGRIGTGRTLASTALGASPYVEEARRWLPGSGDKVTADSLEPVTLSPPHLATLSSSKPRVLCADDNADMRDHFRRLLQDRYDVEAVPDGEAALAAARARLPELVLADVMMPRLDGFGLLRALRADPRTHTTPVILLSARAGEESRVEGLEAGADDYLVKPFSARELLARVGAHVAMNRLRQEAFRREQALLADTQAAKQRLATVLQQISDGFIALDRDWRYTALNDRAREGMAMSRDEILGRRIWDLYPDTIGTRFEAELRRAATEQITIVFEYFYPTRNCWFENRVYPSADGVSIFFADVTDRKRAEEELRVANDRLDLAMRGSNLGIWDLDLAPGGEYRHVPVRFINIWESLGYDPAEFPADAVASRALGHPDDLPQVDAAVAACLAGETEELRVENRIRHRDGSYHWLLTLGKAMRDAAGRPVRLIGTVQDITERKRAEHALRESEAKFRALAENVPSLVWTCTLDKQCDYVNPQFLRYTGQSEAELLGDWRLDNIHPDDHAAMFAAWDHSTGTGEPVEFEARVRRHDGAWRWFQVRAAPIRDERGRIVKWFGTNTDIDDLKRAQESLREARDGLERRVEERTAELARANAALHAEIGERRRAEEARTELLRRLGTAQEDERRRISRELHDGVGQQLTSLILTLKALRDDGHGPLPEPTFLERLQRTAEGVGRELHDVALRLRPTALDDLGLHAALHSAVEEWSRRSGVETDFHSAGLEGRRLPEEVETALYRVVLEALHNVLKHARATHVGVLLERRDHHAVAIVEDDGAGFDAEAAQTGKPAGRLGLLGMRERLALVGGTLEVESAPGAGTTVFARIPLPPEGEGGRP